MPVGRARRFCSWVVACAAALWWSVDMTFLQPSSEPIAGWPAENNTYWARDVRFSLIVLAAVAFVWARGDRRSARWALVGAVGWVAVDVALDRADVSGTTWCAWLAGLTCALLAGLWWWGNRRPARPSSLVLLLAAGTAAGVASTAVAIDSPGGGHAAGVEFSRLVCGGVGLAAALGCALAARRGRVAPAAATVIWLLAAALVVVPAVLSLDLFEGLPRTGLLSSVLFMAVAVQVGFVGAAKEYLLLAVVSLVAAVPFALWALLVAVGLSFVAVLLTALAGSPAVHGGDTDTLATIGGCVLGGMFGLALMCWQFASENRRDASDPETSVTR